MQGGDFGNFHPVADTWFGNNQGGDRRVFFNFFSDLTNKHAQILSVFGMSIPPDFFQDFTVGEHFTAVNNKIA